MGHPTAYSQQSLKAFRPIVPTRSTNDVSGSCGLGATLLMTTATALLYTKGVQTGRVPTGTLATHPSREPRLYDGNFQRSQSV